MSIAHFLYPRIKSLIKYLHIFCDNFHNYSSCKKEHDYNCKDTRCEIVINFFSETIHNIDTVCKIFYAYSIIEYIYATIKK